MEASYNDIPKWKYSKIPEVLTPEGGKTPKTWKIRTRKELEELLEDKQFQNGKGLQVSLISHFGASSRIEPRMLTLNLLLACGDAHGSW